ncbi:MAG TPA: cation:proton antiporter [Acidimicrobiales bacterium]|nr:cation:proton antiporter [Acidimicrobiales bacterium]
MSVNDALLDILIVLVAAKVAAELMERLDIPAVVGEILAGILIGPSALGLVSNNDVLRVLGEIGVILLLLEVGSELELSELAAVGRASMSVATVGVIVPFLGGAAFGGAIGMTGKEAIFVGAALTATSVGITARVLGDLKALAMVESRTILGAAVADDVIGLVILTVVVRLATSGSVSVLGVLWIVLVAVAFLAVTAFIGVRYVPRVFDWIAHHSRSAGTLVAIALAFTLAIAELANEAKLAPIVGAFVAGLALGRSNASDRIRRELQPVGHLFIPVFFLTIGIDVDVDQFVKPSVLALAAVLFAIAVAGKLAAAGGLLGAPGDRLMVGIGMVPRGEVGLIFATIGLSEAIIGQRDYAAILLVVLLTTLATPPVLRLRLEHLRKGARVDRGPQVPRPEGGWLELRAARGGAGVVELVALPPIGDALEVGLHAALMLNDEHRPGDRLVEWLGALPPTPLRFDKPARDRLFALLESGRPRSWRFLQITGLLDRALPELGEAIGRREPSALDLDPFGALHWATLDAVHRELEARAVRGDPRLPHPEWVDLAALVLDAGGGDEPPILLARRVMQRLDLGATAEQAVVALVTDSGLLRRAAHRPDALAEETVLQIAAHIGGSEQAQALYVLTLAAEDLDPVDRARVTALFDLIEAALAHPELTSRSATNTIEQRRNAAVRLAASPAVAARISIAPRAYVLSQAPEALARQAALCEPALGRDEVRAMVIPEGQGRWRIEVAALDRLGLLSGETAALGELGLDISDAVVSTWPDGTAFTSFGVHRAEPPLAEEVKGRIRASLGEDLASEPLDDLDVTFHDDASPWHTLCVIETDDRPGLLHAITAAFAAAGASVHAARITTDASLVVDTFELTDASGAKLDDGRQRRIRDLLASGVRPVRVRRFLRRA